MLSLRCSEQLRARIFSACHKYFATVTSPSQQNAAVALAADNDEYTAEPQYPAIKDNSFKAKKGREHEDWHEQIRSAQTIEEKLIKINMPRYYGYKTFMLSDEKLPYNCLPATQHYTRTLMDAMAETKESNAQQTSFVEAIRGEILDALEYAHECFAIQHGAADLSPEAKEKAWSQMVVEQVHRVLINALSSDLTHLQELEVDYNPRHEAFWSVGGIEPTRSVIKSKEGRKWQKDMAKDTMDRWMQYVGNPYLAIRQRQQLSAWQQFEGSEALAKQVPRFEYDPRTLGYATAYRHGTNIPGHWPNSANSFGSISYQCRAHLQIPRYNMQSTDVQDILNAQAIQASYAWLLAQANYYGFNTFNELTYPMNTQTIITDGQQWSFYEYQLNTLLMHNLQIDSNARVNFCRSVGSATPQQLYGEINAETGKCVGGLNDEVLKNLIRFYANAPAAQQLSAEELRPYLQPNLTRAADHESAEKREFLEKTFKHIAANKSRHLALPETYLWEKIYKIDNKTRPMDARRRFFELDINPWKRTLNQHQKEYIPKAVRPEGPKSRKKWQQTYYP